MLQLHFKEDNLAAILEHGNINALYVSFPHLFSSSTHAAAWEILTFPVIS